MSNSVSSTLECINICQERKNIGLKIFNFGLGQSPLSPPEKLVNYVKLYSDKCHYLPVTGEAELNKQLQQIYDTKHIIVGNGSKEMIFLTMLAFDGPILLINPSWISYSAQAKILNKQIINYNLDPNTGFKIVPEELASILELHNEKQVLTIFNNPVNPTGVTYSSSELQDIANVFKKYNVIVFADEIYEGISTEKTVPFRTLYDKVITSSSVSKIYSSGGYRLGWLAFNDKDIDVCNLYAKSMSIGSEMYSCANAPVQYAFGEYLKHYYSDHECLLTKINNYYDKIRNEFINICKEYDLVCSNSTGGWYVFVSFEKFQEPLKKMGICDSNDLKKEFISRFGVVTVAGCSFEFKGLYLRFSLVESSNVMKEGLTLLCKWLTSL